MPDITRGAPDIGTYRFVLTRTDWAPVHTYREHMYGEIAASRVMEWPETWPVPGGPHGAKAAGRGFPEKNNEAVFMFVNGPNCRTRLTKMGWIDITRDWMSSLDGSKGPTSVQVIDDTDLGEVLEFVPTH